MKAIVIRNNKLQEVDWNTKDILKRVSNKEVLEVVQLIDVETTREENYYHKHRMDLLSKW